MDQQVPLSTELAEGVQPMGPRMRRGFTLLEMMVVVAIIGIVSAMSVSTFIQLGAKNATQNAANDIYSTLQAMRSRSTQRGTDVYAIVYPTYRKTGLTTGTTTGGPGAIFFYEDSDGDFMTGSGSCNGSSECSWLNFNPPVDVRSAPTERDRFLQAIFLDDYPKANVRFGKELSKEYGVPFKALDTPASAAGCSFCDGERGATVFSDGQALFFDAAGVMQPIRVGGFALQGVSNPSNQFLIGFVRATGLIASVR